ncbi:unnamed protein product [Penicillium discolor]
MSELLGSQELKPVSDCHLSPQYHLCEPNPDMLTSVIENERTRRLVLQQCEKMETELDDLIENHPMHDNDKDIMLKIDYLEKLSLFPKEQIQLTGKLIRALKELSSTGLVDNMNDKLGPSPPSYNTAASVRKASDGALSKPPRGFWKKFWKCSARI